MAKNETKRLRPSTLRSDVDALAALAGIAGYAPTNPAYALTKLQSTQDDMIGAQEVETQKRSDADAARDDATAAEWAFHNAILGAKDQVKAQFGPDSNEWQALGLTKKSEIAKPQTKTQTATTAVAA